MNGLVERAQDSLEQGVGGEFFREPQFQPTLQFAVEEKTIVPGLETEIGAEEQARLVDVAMNGGVESDSLA